VSKARAVLEKSKPFNEFDDATLDRFIADASTQEFSSGDVLFHELSEGEAIYFIVEGEIRISVELASAHHMAEEIDGGPGELVGEGRFITDGPRPATVTAATDVTALVWNVADWKSIAQENPVVGYQLAIYAGKVLFERVGKLRDHLINDISWGLE
jgi:CRP-like cAMP-binding protein